IAVNPSGENGGGASGVAGRPVRPFRVEAELDVAIAPRSGNGASLAEVAGPRPRQFAAIASELQSAAKHPGVARNFHFPLTAGVRAVLHRQWARASDAYI